MSNITEDQLKKMYRLSNDTAFRIQNTLKIKDKEGVMSPFVFNEVQKFIQERLEDQKKRTGRVRAIILKGRKQGCSTLVALFCSNINLSVYPVSIILKTFIKLCFEVLEKLNKPLNSIFNFGNSSFITLSLFTLSSTW